MGAVGLDGPHREEQLFGNLGVCVPKGDQPQDLDLALGEVIGRTGRRLGGDPALRAAG